jgi:ribose/xylose/arabinose/galactoside ABC-type transport system permease subunit
MSDSHDSTLQKLLRYSPLRFNEWALVLAIAAVFAFTVIMDRQHSYIDKQKWFLCLEDIVRSFSLYGIVALGAMVVIIAGGIDLSVGSLIALCAVVTASTLMLFADVEDRFLSKLGPLPVIVAIGAALLTGIIVGTLHTWLITSIDLPPFVATLATLVGLRSFARVLCEYARNMKYGDSSASDIYVSHPFFAETIKNPWVMLSIFLGMAFITWFFLNFTVLGRHTYALGGNEQAARLSGIRTIGVKWFVYCFAALTAAIAGIFNLANGGGAQPAGQAAGYELTAIAAAVVGGCSLKGGAGTVPGTLLGALFLRLVIDSIYRIIDTSADKYEGMIVGVVVALAVTLTQLRELLQSGRQFFPGKQGYASIVAIATFGALLITMFSVYVPSLKPHGYVVGGISFAVLCGALGLVKFWESRRDLKASISK